MQSEVTVDVYYFQIYWSENGELMCISTDESFFILKYKQEAVDQAAENSDLVTEDGIEDAFDVSISEHMNS